MDLRKKAKLSRISWFWVAVSFIFGAWPIGVALTVMKLMGEQAQEDLKKEQIRQVRENIRKMQQEGFDGEVSYKETYQDVKFRTVKEGKTVHTTQWQGSSYRSGKKTAENTEKEQQRTNGYNNAHASYYANDALRRKLGPSSGKGLQIAGGVCLAVACLGCTIGLLEGFLMSDFLEALIGTIAIGFSIGLPGLVLLATGTNKRKRAARCRNHLAMIGKRRTVSLDEIDMASPGSFKTVCRDLEWMLGQGFFPGAYLDMGRRVFTYPGETVPVQEKQKEAPKATRDASGRKVYPEEQTIRRLDERIEDLYVSERIQRLAKLTHQILAYVEQNPEKESSIRQFRNHYLPKTINILEAYARMEQQNVSGANIRSAMADVEQIMDKLVAGFEKQLDALFDQEAMDVTTDINVLENLMNMEGLGDLDPFGAARKREYESK